VTVHRGVTYGRPIAFGQRTMSSAFVSTSQKKVEGISARTPPEHVHYSTESVREVPGDL